MGFSSAYGPGLLQPGVCTSTTRPASPRNGMMIYETDTGLQKIWTGTQWSNGVKHGNDLTVEYLVIAGGGGGGAGAVGGNAASSVGGTGGAGVSSQITGTPVTRGGGGGGSAITGTVGSGGAGGGGNASLYTQAASSGTTNTGGGGGAGGTPGSGGSGVVIIRYLTDDAGGFSISGGTVSTSGSYTIRTFNASGSLVVA